MNDPVNLSLHMPEPPARPGDRPDFSYLALSAAGAVRRPDSSEPESAMRDMPYAVVRVLDDQAREVGPLAPEVLRTGLGARVARSIARPCYPLHCEE